MIRDRGTGIIQAMPFTDGLINLESGTYSNVTLISCIEDGTLTILFPTGNSYEVSMEAGKERSVERGTSVTITEGKFDLD